MISTAVTPSAARCAIEAGWASPANVPRALSGIAGIQARKAAQVELVDDERFDGDPLAAGLARRRRRAGDGFWRVRAAVLAIGEHRGMQAERAVEAPGVRVGEQLGGVESQPPRRIVRALDPKSVARCRAKSGRKATKDAACVAGHRRRGRPRGRRRKCRAKRPRRGAGRAPLRAHAARRPRRGRHPHRSCGRARDRAIERGVALRRPAPGDVRAHAVEPETPHRRRIAENRQRPIERVTQGLDRESARTGRRSRRQPSAPPRWRRSPYRRGRRRATRPAGRRSAMRRAGSARKARSAKERGRNPRPPERDGRASRHSRRCSRPTPRAPRRPPRSPLSIVRSPEPNSAS